METSMQEAMQNGGLQKPGILRHASGETMETVISPENSMNSRSDAEQHYVSDEDTESVEEEDDYAMEDEQVFLAKRDSMMSMSDGSSEYSSGSFDSDDDYSDDEYTNSGMSTSNYTSSSGDSDDWSSDEESQYDDLMSTLPIALGRKGPPAPGAAPVAGSFSSLASSQMPPAPEGLPVPLMPTGGGVPGPDGSVVGELTDPMEGLAMFQNIRSELEQVGRMIVAKKDGEKFLQRAHILASINWLSSNVPSCVLDHLGKEIRGSLKKKEKKEEEKPSSAYDLMSRSFHVDDDLSSDGSELSDAYMYASDSDYSFGEDTVMTESEMIERVTNSTAQRVPPQRSKSSSSGEKSLASLAKLPNMRNGASRPGVRRTKSHEEKPNAAPSLSLVAHARRGSMLGGAPTAQARRSTLGGASIATSNSSQSAGMADRGPVPHVEHFECALLFVDISGFTKLATMLDPENLSKVINSYFQQIVDKVFEYQGDIQKFAGDALFAEWRVSSTTSLSHCVEAAAACASSLIIDCADFPVMAFGGTVGQGKLISHLNLHCGLGVGQMAGIHIGDSELRREYVYVGNPIHQATGACDRANLGEVVASRQVHNVLSWSGIIADSFEAENQEYVRLGNDDIERLKTSDRMATALGKRNAKNRGVTDHVDGLEVEALIEYRRLMSLYVHPVVVSNDVAASDGFRSSRVTSSVQERHREEAELRDVYVMFIKPLVSTELHGDYKNSAQGLNDIMTLTTRELQRYNGHLRQFIMDDKGLVLIATFGLRGSTFPNLVAERALPATVVIYNALQMELGIDCRIGATFGDVYCGPVGGVARHEYAVMGPAVNLAARLMASPENPGLLVDNAVRRLAAQSYSFNALAPVKAKGYKDLVPIFEPLTALERPWGKLIPTFVGRREEIVKLMDKAKRMKSTEDCPPNLVLVSSPSGMGKSTMLAHSIEHIRKMFGPSQSTCLISKNVGKESDAHVPFRAIRPMLLKVLKHFEEVTESRSRMSGSCYPVDLSDACDNASTGSQATDLNPSVTQARDSLNRVGDLIKAKDGIADRVRLMVLEDASTQTLRTLRNKPTLITRMANFIAEVFRLCTKDRKLTIVALDDIHHTDEASWLVLREVFETADNVLILGTTFSTADNTFRMEPHFWSELKDIYSKNGRFETMELSGLSNEDLETMTMKTLGLQRHEIPQEALNEVVVQSGGMPRFASKILEGIKERGMSEKAIKVDESISEIILHRIDSFDLSIRNTLNVGAVLGETFKFADVLAVLRESSDSREEDLRRQVVESLSESLNEGILEIVGAEGDLDATEACENDETQFSFHHRVWRSTLLGLMLDSRKRDVHRKIAMSMNKVLEADGLSLDFKIKLFSHWKATGDTAEATSIALLAGQEIQDETLNFREASDLYIEALKMWDWNKEEENRVAGLTSDVLEAVDAKDLSNIIRLMVAYGRALYSAKEAKESISILEDTLRLYKLAKTSSQLEDRSVVFPAFAGLAKAIEDGHIDQDVNRQYEASMLRRFLEDTRIHGRLIHHIYALYLQMVFYSCQNELEKAIAVQSIIKKLFKPDKHADSLRKLYGLDVGTASFSLAAFFEMTKGDNRQALRSCRHVLKELLPRAKTDSNQALATMYPLVLVLKEAGFSNEARAFFEKVVVQPFAGKEDGDSSFPVLAVFEALSMLFTLTGKEPVKGEKLDSYVAWALKSENLKFDENVNLRLARLGRCMYTVCAEICLQLAGLLPDGGEKDMLLDYGRQLVEHATMFHRKNCLSVARRQAQLLSSKFKMVGATSIVA